MQVRWKTDGAQHNHNDFRFSPLSKTSFLITVRYDHALQSVLYTYTYTYSTWYMPCLALLATVLSRDDRDICTCKSRVETKERYTC